MKLENAIGIIKGDSVQKFFRVLGSRRIKQSCVVRIAQPKRNVLTKVKVNTPRGKHER